MKIKVKGLKETIYELENIKSLEDIDKKLTKECLQLLREIVITSPVRTGRYKNGWEFFKSNRLKYLIKNPVEYSSFLIYGTCKMSVKHDVRGMIEKWKDELSRKL